MCDIFLMCYLCGCLFFWEGFWAIVLSVTVCTVSDHDYCMRWETKAQEAQNTVSQHIKMRWFSICYLHLCVIFLHLFRPLNLQPHTHREINFSTLTPPCYSFQTPMFKHVCVCVYFPCGDEFVADSRFIGAMHAGKLFQTGESSALVFDLFCLLSNFNPPSLPLLSIYVHSKSFHLPLCLYLQT